MSDTAEIQTAPAFLDNIVMLPVVKLEWNPWNPNHMDEKDLKKMAARFKRNGKVDKPVTARPLNLDEGIYQIIDGQQTCVAAAMAGFADVPVMIEDMDDINAIATTFVKNLHGTMNWLKVGRNILKMKQLASERGEDLKNTEIARMMGKSEGAIRNYLLYPELSEILNGMPSRDGFPTDDEIGGMGSDKLREVMKEVKEFLENPSAEPISPKGEKEQPTEEQKQATAYSSILSAIPVLSPQQRILLRKDLNKLINEDKKRAGTEEDHTDGE